MRNALVVLWILLCSTTGATAQVSVAIGLPNVSIGINLALYPELVRVPGYPVYYAPRLNSNYFFYDGMYWVYQDDSWYASSWYNGPWSSMNPELVPLYVLRIPVGYYRLPPAYFRGWYADAPPHWGEHWGNAWAQRRSGWDHWQRDSMPAPAPLPVYQQKYSADRYPGLEQQQALHTRNYRYQPRDPVVRQAYQAPRGQSAAAPAQGARQEAPAQRNSARTEQQRANPPQQREPSERQQTQSREHEPAQRQEGPRARDREGSAASREPESEAQRTAEPDRGRSHEKTDERGKEHRK